MSDALLTRFYGRLPNIVAGLHWNWEGKLLALVATLVVAALPAFGWRRAGLTFRQVPGSLKAALPVALLYCLFFLAIALAFLSSHADGEEMAFQLTMPGFGERYMYVGQYEEIRPGDRRYAKTYNMVSDTRAMAAALRSRRYRSLRMQVEVLDDEDHLMVAPRGFTRGLTYLLPDPAR